MSDPIECPICNENITQKTGIVTMNCGHRYHMRCIVQWFQQPDGAGCCPMCRAMPSEMEQIRPAHDLHSVEDSDDESDESDESDDSNSDEVIPTQLMSACEDCEIDIVRQLLSDPFINVNEVDGNNETALVYALRFNEDDTITSSLIDAHADLKYIVSMFMAEEVVDESYPTPNFSEVILMAGCTYDSPSVVQRAIDLGSNPNYIHPITGMTPLLCTTTDPGMNSCTILKQLLKVGADVFAMDKKGNTVFANLMTQNTLETDDPIVECMRQTLLEHINPMYRFSTLKSLAKIIKIQSVWRGYSLRKKSVFCNTIACLEIGRLMCSTCRTTKYCSVGCQRTDWHLHKKVCRH